jgi:hypothetical protein
MDRVLAAARLHLIRPLVTLGVPWLIAGTSFALTLALWATVGIGEENPDAFAGGVTALYATLLVAYVQAVTRLLPFAMGISISRRAFFLGTAVVVVGQSVVYGVILSALVSLEGATGGWGAGLRFWAPAGIDVDDPVLQVAVSGAPLLAFAAVGVGFGIVYKRWGQVGAWTTVLLLMLALGGLAVLISWAGAWSDVGGWFADRSLPALTIGLPAALAALVVLLSYPGIRRVVP